MNQTIASNKQPLALYYLFAVEFWERFGFYTVRGLFILYMTKVFLFSDSHSYGLFGAFTALLWLTPAIGGYLADKILGYRRALTIGGVLLTLGYVTLAFNNKELFYFGLSILIVGMGFFKSNVASLVGTLYGKNDARRDGGFTIYYMGINIGGLSAALISGFLVQAYGWQAGFIFAATGMFIGLLTFLFGQRLLKDRGLPPAQQVQSRIQSQTQSKVPWFFKKSSLLIFIGSIAAILLTYFLLYHVALANVGLEVIGALIILVYLYEAFKQTHTNRYKMLGCLVLTAFSIAFWVLYQQAPMTVNLFTERNVNREFMHHLIPTVSFQSLNPFFIIVFTPVLNWLWKFLQKKQISFTTSLKFTAAIFLMGIGFLVLKWSVTFFSHGGIVSMWWVVLSYGLQSFAELMLQPIGLAMMTAMSPKNLSGLMVGTWFLASAISNAIAGSVAQVADVSKGADTPVHSAGIYAHAFGVYGWWAIGIGFIALLTVPFLSRIMDEYRNVKLDE
jgi:POT family proton-dependent oligopeptide transporter